VADPQPGGWWILGCHAVRSHLRAFRRLPVDERYAIVARLRADGWALVDIAAATGYSRERVRVIIATVEAGCKKSNLGV
jgi:hypothetical protein